LTAVAADRKGIAQRPVNTVPLHTLKPK
jgi:hypothetical protein